MAYVQFKSIESGEVENAGRAELASNGLVVFHEMRDSLRRRLESEPIRDNHGHEFWPRDGMAYLNALKWEFRGGYLAASDVKV